MKPAAVCTLERLIAWDDFEVTALHSDSSDSLDGRSDENPPDSDQDERAPEELILHRVIHGAS